MGPNLVGLIKSGELLPKDVAVICKVVREHGEMPNCHPGVLPFVSGHKVMFALSYSIGRAEMGGDRPRSRYLAKLLCIVKNHMQKRFDEDQYLFKLNDAKVRQHFGRRPGRGIPVPGKTVIHERTETREMWGKVKEVTIREQLPAMMAVFRVKPNCWKLHVDPKFRADAVTWLNANCI